MYNSTLKHVSVAVALYYESNRLSCLVQEISIYYNEVYFTVDVIFKVLSYLVLFYIKEETLIFFAHFDKDPPWDNLY